MGKEDLLNAVKDGNSQYVRKVLHKYRRGSKKGGSKKSSSINHADADGFTALHYAALSGDVDMIMAIMQMDADPNVRDQKGMNPLHMSAWAGKQESLAALLENRALPNLPAFSGDTPLHLAAQHGYAGCAKVLLSAHADGCFRNGFLETPLDLACQYGHTAVVNQLLLNPNVKDMICSPVIDSRYKSPLHLASKSGHDDIVHILLEQGANVNEERAEGTALHVAALYGKTEAVQVLLQAGADVSKKNNNNLLPLDVVNKFTTSRAALEIKQMLREAAGERVVYAKAICDYNNPSSENSIHFKMGECIAIIDQSEDGCWRGYVVNSMHEQVGYFPSMTVQLLSNTKKASSVSSFGSSVESYEQQGGRSSSSNSASSPEKLNIPASPKSQPVGIVPLGSFEVVALSQTDPEYHSFPKQTANGCFAPGMGSFKQKQNLSAPSAKLLQRSFSAQSPPSRLHPQVSADGLMIPSIQRPSSADHRGQLVKQHTAPSPSEIQKLTTADENRLKFAQTLNRHSSKSKYANQQQQGEFRQRASSSGSANHEMMQKRQMAIDNRANESSPRQRSKTITSSTAQSELARAFQEGLQQNRRSTENVNYANVQITPNASPTTKQPYQPTDYTTVYIADGKNNVHHSPSPHPPTQHAPSQQAPSLVNNNSFLVQQNSSTKTNNSPPHNSNQTKLKPILSKNTNLSRNEPSDYENIFETKPKSNSVSFAHTPEEKRKMQMNNGYEVMSGYTENQSNIKAVSEYKENEAPNLPLKRSAQLGRNSKVGEELEVDEEDGTTRFLKHGSEHILLDQKLSISEKEVMKWLSEFKLTCYFDNFQTNGFDMISIRAITPEDLNIMDITKTGHRKKILSEVAKLPTTDQLPSKKPLEVGTWLGDLNLRQYEANFIEGGFDDIDFIKDLDRNDLEMIDIKKKGHQKKILMAVQKLHDLELTAILDRAVAESPLSRTSSFRSQREVRQEVQDFFATTSPSYNMASVAYPLSPRDDLPPPSGEEQSFVPPNHTNGFALPSKPVKPIKNPVPVPPKPGNMLAKKHSDTPPAPKPKPKPSLKPVVTSNATTNGNITVITNNFGRVSMQAPSEAQGDGDEAVTSSRSRDFFKNQEKQLDSTSPNSTLNRSRTSSNASTSSNPSSEPRLRASSTNNAPPSITKVKPKVKAEKPQQPLVGTPATLPVVTKKAPPPAPPKRRTNSKVEEDHPAALMAAPTTPQPSAPVSPQLNDFLPPPPIVSPPPIDEEDSISPLPPPPLSPTSPSLPLPPPSVQVTAPSPLPPSSPVKQTVTANDGSSPVKQTVTANDGSEDIFMETDNIMADIMADIDDFSAQLDSMF